MMKKFIVIFSVVFFQEFKMHEKMGLNRRCPVMLALKVIFEILYNHGAICFSFKDMVWFCSINI